MAVVVLLLGILAAGAGLAAIGFAVPNIGTDFGNTLIIAGATGLTGGLILFGLAVAVGQLTRIAEGLRARTRPARSPEAPLPPRPETLQSRPEPIPPRAEPVVPLPDIGSLHAPCCARTAAERHAVGRVLLGDRTIAFRPSASRPPGAGSRGGCAAVARRQCHSSGGRDARAHGTSNAPWFRGGHAPAPAAARLLVPLTGRATIGTAAVRPTGTRGTVEPIRVHVA